MKIEILKDMIIIDEDGKLTFLKNLKKDTIKNVTKVVKDFINENK